MLAALNGLIGDRLEQQHSALAIPMALRPALDARRRGALLLLVHGSSMNDRQWSTTRRVGEQSPAIAAATDVLAELELQFAKARFANDYQCVAPLFSSGTLSLDKARHPLLERNLKARGGNVVPLTVELGSARVEAGESPASTRPAWLLLAASLYLLAMFAKETGIVLPLALVAYELIFHREPLRERLRALVLRMLPFVAAAALYLALRYHALRGIGHPVVELPARAFPLKPKAVRFSSRAPSETLSSDRAFRSKTEARAS